MGLDMYLTKRTYVRGANTEVVVWHKRKVREDIQSSRVNYIIEEVAYWRKANAIHRWFVLNVQGGEDNCEEHYVSIENLQELLTVCEKVLADNTLAHELLPSQEGFFFGSTDYEEYYFSEIERTVTMLRDIIKEYESDNRPEDTWDPSFYYQSSW